MNRTRTTASIVASPVLIGALTVLITVVAVFLAYNANNGLPFVPTYDLKAQLPDAEALVAGNEVRVGGHRVGAVTEIKPVHEASGRTYAVIQMKLDKEIQPLPIDSRVLVRARSALGLKYIELTPGTASAGYKTGDTIPLAAAKPRPVELDQVLNIFDRRTQIGIRRSLEGFGNGLTGRGQDLNETIAELPPFLSDLQPVASNLADQRTRLRALFPALGRAARLVAPVAETQARLFENLDTTFGALARVARPYIQQTISLSPPTLDTAIRDFPIQRPFFENTAAFMHELRPGVHVLPATLPDLADALHIGRTTLRRSPPFNRRLANVFRALEDFSTDPLVSVGVSRLTDTVRSLRPTLRFLAPVQTKCNYITLWFRNIGSLLSEGDTNGTWQRFIIVATPQGPNSESGPSSAPASGPTEDNYLHSNTYPNTASPGQSTVECESGNENYYIGKKVLGNAPGNSGTKTDGQVGP
ncbi:MAG: phospholipid/cholesterol/gamma-HCH transport system substrate-binding protein [Thermoleophilaceae bacterium]|nr:phospholipid/cholesterol/gamma-HCH transport system substrate-binding protein [Thermoleophilaceae bacterium]MEA2353205.1 phospholipid/cholesterol/gamma-HCH transport system substrate-binding protein [Thermoleophilaceae bacterium]MEA2369517.1 phospholipid/cholesterol/gamma-HCH transport system substrate-binding protein [Thermoleophilaceae bacterium]